MPELKLVSDNGLKLIGIPLAMTLNNLLDTIESKKRDLFEKIGRETCKKKLIFFVGGG
ncbi:MAG: hypothetical protein L6Q53_03950 [Candidatus Brocadia sinica]|nr:hypothetical protein [Candidatus Brocadia sinica]